MDPLRAVTLGWTIVLVLGLAGLIRLHILAWRERRMEEAGKRSWDEAQAAAIRQAQARQARRFTLVDGDYESAELRVLKALGYRCHAGTDGDCTWEGCPQLRDGEPSR